MRFLPGLYTVFLIVACQQRDNKPVSTVTDSTKKSNTWFFAFNKVDSINPILSPDPNHLFDCPIQGRPIKWEEKDVFNPATVVRNDTVFMLYRAEDMVGKHAGTSRIGLAWSTDGLHFTRHAYPVLYPDNGPLKSMEWEGGCEDPRIVENDAGSYIMTYTAYDGDKARLMVATSTDLYHWIKLGPAFARAYNGRYLNYWSKSGSIVSIYRNGSPIANKVNGSYWMYWGDTNIFLATSDDLINWVPLETEHKIPFKVFGPRKGKFDSGLVEPGPPAMIEEKGIRLIYNSRNILSQGDSSLEDGAYAPGYILFDRNGPAKIIERSASYFIKPNRPYEINGQVKHVCFLEGLVNYKGHWYLYYGAADSRIAAAVN
jgi:predicted GH43/DUF377 family glycosyl hydrolase